MALRAQRAGSLAQKATEHPARELKASAPVGKIDLLTKRLSDSGDKIEDSNRFLKEIIAPALQASIPHMVESAHRQHGDKMGFGIISNKRNNFQTIHIGQANFKQDYIGRLLLDFVNGTRSRMSNLSLETGKLKLLPQSSRLSRLVVNKQNGFFSLCAHPWNLSRLKGRSATSGFSGLPNRASIVLILLRHASVPRAHFTVRPFKTIPEGSVHVHDSPAGPRP
jgi:hypothetical protein